MIKAARAAVVLGFGLVWLAGGAAAAKPAAKSPGKWIQLFNGKNLDGWKVKITGHELGDNFGDTFRVEGGVLKVAYDKYENFAGKFGHLIYDRRFSAYRLRVEYRFVGQQLAGGPNWAFRNNGLMLHGQPPESMSKEQRFPVSLEMQLLGGKGAQPGAGGEARSTGNLCTPGTNVVIDGKLITQHSNKSSSPTFHGDQWVTAEAEVHGSGLIRHIINGQTVLTYSQPQLDETDADARKLIKDGKLLLDGGYISLQAESHPIEFRKVELLVLED